MNELAYHHVAHTVDNERLFEDAEEAAYLWHALARVLPRLVALVLMPNHLHLLHPRDVREPLRGALGNYARWYNRRQARRGRLFLPLPPPTARANATAIRRDRRYIHLNPCRGVRPLVPDPLAWPWSTHRDAVGWTLQPVIERELRPLAFHAYVSGDPSVSVEGTELPYAHGPAPSPALVMSTLASLARVPESAMMRRGRWRTLYLGVARTVCDATFREIRDVACVGKNAKVPTPPAAVVTLVRGAVNDPRMQSVTVGTRWGGRTVEMGPSTSALARPLTRIADR